MFIGDSITEGTRSANGLGFRDDFGSKLAEIGYSHAFVGIFGPVPFQGHFDEGARVEQFYSGNGGDGTLGIEPDMDLNQPHIAVIHLGTNHLALFEPMAPYSYDGGINFTTETVAGLLANFIEYLLKWHNGERGNHLQSIFVSQIIPNTQHPDKVATFNAEIGRLVQDANGGRLSRIPVDVVRLVDQHSSFVVETMMDPDGVHPNDPGYEHMADVLFDDFCFLPLFLVRETEEAVNGAFGSPLPEPLKVRVTDAHDNGIPGVDVSFQVTGGDAVLMSSQPVQTDALGMAQTQVQLGVVGTSTISAYSGGLIDSEVTFLLTAAEFVRIQGMAAYFTSQAPIPEVDVRWIEGGALADVTDGSGRYDIGQFRFGESVTLHPEKDRWSHTSGLEILSYDAALTARQAVGLEALSAERHTAADVDGDGTVTMMDAAQTARYAVGIDLPEDIHIGEWRFMPDRVYYDNLNDDFQNQNFAGILVGDVHGGWPGSSPLYREGESGSMILISDVEDNSFITVHLGFEGKFVISSDFYCRYDPEVLELREIEKTASIQSFHLNYKIVDAGTCRMGCFGTESLAGSGSVITLRFKVKKETLFIPLELRELFINDHLVDDLIVNVASNNGFGVLNGVDLIQNAPNPFNEDTVIRFQIPEMQKIQLEIYNSNGQKVVTLLDGEKASGTHEVRWDGRNHLGGMVPSGIYFYRLLMDQKQIVKKMVKVR